MVSEICRVVIPFAYIEIILSSIEEISFDALEVFVAQRTLAILRDIYLKFTIFTADSFGFHTITVVRLTGSFITVIA